MDIASIGINIYSFIQYMIKLITNFVKKQRGEETVYPPEELTY